MTDYIIRLNKETEREIKDLFSGIGPMDDGDKFIGDCIKRFMRDTAYLIDLRQSMSESGAMRWPWSQEAWIDRKMTLNCGKLK